LLDNCFRDLLEIGQRSVWNSNQKALGLGAVSLVELDVLGVGEENVSNVVLQALIVHFQLVQALGNFGFECRGLLLKWSQAGKFLHRPSS